MIFLDSDWNPQMNQQAEDQAHRIGQEKGVRVFVLVSVGSIEEVILKYIISKSYALTDSTESPAATIFFCSSHIEDSEMMSDQLQNQPED